MHFKILDHKIFSIDFPNMIEEVRNDEREDSDKDGGGGGGRRGGRKKTCTTTERDYVTKKNDIYIVDFTRKQNYIFSEKTRAI